MLGKTAAIVLALMACISPALRQGPALAHCEDTIAPPEKTQVWSVPDPRSGRNYSVSISLPDSYDSDPRRRYPILYVTDADYGFPAIGSLMHRINRDAQATDEFIVVGLSYAKDEDPADSRLRDYTPVPRRDQRGGGGPEYQAYLRDTVFPYVESRLRADSGKRVYVGHSYGALLGVRIMLTEPGMFYGYILGSPSLWYANHAIYDLETAYAEASHDLPAKIFLYVGEYEAANPDDSRYNKTLDMVKDNADLVGKLTSRGYQNLQIRSEVIPSESHLTVFPTGFAKGIVDILPPPPRSAAANSKISADITPLGH